MHVENSCVQTYLTNTALHKVDQKSIKCSLRFDFTFKETGAISPEKTGICPKFASVHICMQMDLAVVDGMKYQAIQSAVLMEFMYQEPHPACLAC